MHLSEKVVSAPGKVLLTGGYLVLDREHTGLVFALDARIYVHIQGIPTSTGVALTEIIVRSPQFRHANWRYGYRQTAQDGGVEVTELRAFSFSALHQNPFVETALAFALSYVASITHTIPKSATITILADKDYYSQPTTHVPSSNEGNKFVALGVPLWEAHKTGLGSSAALVTAIVAAMLVHYLPDQEISLSTDAGKARLHNLAQAAHSAAQGKIGSGFDVASAVYGSCTYRRFSPSLLQSHGEVGSAGFATRLRMLVDDKDEAQKWDAEVVKSAVAVPEGLRLVMCDVDCGSKTPGMVKKVLSWRKSKAEEANQIWTELQKRNDALAAELTKIEQQHSQDYSRLKECIGAIRASIRDMSEKSGVPIEPEAQTELLDACSCLPGVIGGVVPGAGGFDAIALFIEDKPEVVGKLHGLLDGWTVRAEAGAEAGAEAVIGKVRMLGVRQEMDGVRMEDSKLFEPWLGSSNS